MKTLATIGVLGALLSAPVWAQEVSVEALKPGEGAGNTLGEHKFVLTFERSSYHDVGLIKDKFERDGIFAEILDEIAAQIALPHDVPVTFQDCGMANAFWSPNDRDITYCYELIQMYNDSYEELESDDAAIFKWADQNSVLTGTTLFVLLHELGHGLVDMFDLPITGKEEDAVDQFAALTLIGADEEGDSFEERPSRMALLGAYFFRQLASAPEQLSRRILADVHALGQQRYYDVMCLVLGSDMDTYAPILIPGANMVLETLAREPGGLDEDKLMDWLAKTDELNILPARRALGCEQEFLRYDASWDYLIDTFTVARSN